MEPTHASWFSGVGGLDLGLERAGWRTVSFSEIDPYASAVLAERWPGVPNLGDIVVVRSDDLAGSSPAPDVGTPAEDWDGPHGGCRLGASGTATLWTGGFPCQDLSVAGKRAGFAGERSSLAFAFLDLVERHRPPAILLENVLGLLSSHRGRDMAALTGRMAELGYGVAYRVLDARHFGVPQRRRRVFILGLRSGPDDPTGRLAAERAAAVLAVGTRCPRHPAAGGEARPNAADGVGAGVSRALSTSQERLDADTESFVVRSQVDADRMRTPYELAGRLDDSDGVVQSLDTKRGGPDDNEAQAGHPVAFVKAGRAQTADDGESWTDGSVMPTLNAFDVGDVRTTAAVLGTDVEDDPLLPLGLDSNRYRCCGNGVVANVSEWLGLRLIAELAA